MQPPLSQRTQQDEVLRHSRRGWISVHDYYHGKVGANALAWLEQLPHGEVWLHAFRAYWTTLEQACQLNLSNKPPSAHARPRGHPRIIRTEPAARLRPGRLQHMPRPFACLAQALLRPEGLLPRRPLQAAKPVPTGRTQYAHKQKTS